MSLFQYDTHQKLWDLKKYCHKNNNFKSYAQRENFNKNILHAHCRIFYKNNDMSFFIEIIDYISDESLDWFCRILSSLLRFDGMKFPEELYWKVRDRMENLGNDLTVKISPIFYRYLSILHMKGISDAVFYDIFNTYYKKIDSSLYSFVTDERMSWQQIVDILEKPIVHGHIIRRLFSSNRFNKDQEKMSFVMKIYLSKSKKDKNRIFYILLNPFVSYDEIYNEIKKSPRESMSFLKETQEALDLFLKKVQLFTTDQKVSIYLQIPEISQHGMIINSLDVSISLLG